MRPQANARPRHHEYNMYLIMGLFYIVHYYMLGTIYCQFGAWSPTPPVGLVRKLGLTVSECEIVSAHTRPYGENTPHWRRYEYHEHARSLQLLLHIFHRKQSQRKLACMASVCLVDR